MYNLDLFSDLNTIIYRYNLRFTMAAAAAPALYFHEQQKVFCVLAMMQGKTFPQICQEFVVKYANTGPEYKREPPSAKRVVTRYTVN